MGLSACTTLNDFKLPLSFDQDQEPTGGMDYDLGGLVLSAGYEGSDKGGSLGGYAAPNKAAKSLLILASLFCF